MYSLEHNREMAYYKHKCSKDLTSTKFTLSPSGKVIRWDGKDFPPEYAQRRFYYVNIDLSNPSNSATIPLTHDLFDHLIMCDIQGQDLLEYTPELPLGTSLNSAYWIDECYQSTCGSLIECWRTPGFDDHLAELDDYEYIQQREWEASRGWM